MLRAVSVLVILIFCTGPALQAQINNEYQIATRLMQQQRYEQALPIFKRVYDRQPNVFQYFSGLVDCYIQLKKYGEAEELSEMQATGQYYPALASVEYGKVLHLLGEKERAISVWQQNLSQHSNQLQVYVSTANTMSDRKEFDEAIAVYKKARKVFNNDKLFLLDVPNTYMKAGEYDAAIGEWLELIRSEPGQIGAIQRLLLRYNDPVVYDITILELDDALESMPFTEPAYQNFYELQIWLLLENQLFKRAFRSAMEYETRTKSFNFSLFNVGRQLSENNEFELAVESFTYYRTAGFGEIKWRAMEEIAGVYLRWANYLDDYQLLNTSRKDSLFGEANRLLGILSDEAPSYSRIRNVYLLRAELALDNIFDTETARESLAKLIRIQGGESSPQSNYLEGRLALADTSFTEARISLTRANKQAEGSDLSEKSRYFLALTDFYSGDHEFAKIQLKSLGRKNTSYYANDALSLRLWLQKGLAADSTGGLLNTFAQAHFDMNHGQPGKARVHFMELLEQDGQPFKEDALLLLARLPDPDVTALFTRITDFLDTSDGPVTQREQLMWLRARYALEYHTLYTGNPAAEEVVDAFESLILEYPQGFYAPYARKELNRLINPAS